MDGSSPPRARATDTRARILDTALELFTAQGFQRTPLRSIADRLGLTKAAILYHYPTKDDLLAALVEPLLQELEGVLETALSHPPRSARQAALEGFLDAMLRHRRALGMLVHDMALLARGKAYTRLFSLVTRMNQVVAGPEPTRLDRVRAVQAFAMLSDPVVMIADIPDDVLRADMLDGVRRLLPDLPTGPPPPRPPTDHRRPEPPAEPARPARATDGTRWPPPADGTGRPPPTDGTPPDPPAGRRDPTAGGPAVEPAVEVERLPAPAGARSGRAVGRPRAMTPERIRAARQLYADGSHTVDEIATRIGVSRATVYRHLAARDHSNEASPDLF
nr:TetR family transcriptional regulator [Micromonospora sp. DSM 115978]